MSVRCLFYWLDFMWCVLQSSMCIKFKTLSSVSDFGRAPVTAAHLSSGIFSEQWLVSRRRCAETEARPWYWLVSLSSWARGYYHLHTPLFFLESDGCSLHLTSSSVCSHSGFICVDKSVNLQRREKHECFVCFHGLLSRQLTTIH